MGLITVHLFTGNAGQIKMSQNCAQKQTQVVMREQTDLHDQFNNILVKTRQSQYRRIVPTFTHRRLPPNKKIAPPSLLQIHDWHTLFFNYKLFHIILSFLNCEDLLMLKHCSRFLRRRAVIKILQNDSNWDLTFAILAPCLLQQTQLKQSGVEDDYQHSEDLDRTSGYFQNQNSEDLMEHQVKLDRIITTVSFKVQYFQGIMPICASLLQCFNENISYWLLRYLLHKCRYIQNDIEFYNEYVLKLDDEFRVLLPQVYGHLQLMGFELNYFVMKWIMGLFSEDMSKPMVLGLWDLLCQTDVYVLIYAIIQIFRVMGQEILMSDSDQINQMLKGSLKDRLSGINCEELIRCTKQLYICRRLVIF